MPPACDRIDGALGEVLWRLRDHAKDRLAADHDELVLAEDVGSSRDDMLEIRSSHALSDLFQDLSPFSFTKHPGERGVLS